jgi:peptidyl-prolyl cis-trans isomerase D
MLQFFRNIFKTKLGLLITFGLLALIALAFATADVANTGSFGGVAGGDRAAVVGDERIATADLARAATQALERARQQNPTLSMQSFIAQGGLEEVLNQLIDRAAIAEYAREHGFRAGDNLINSEIQAIGAFRGADGNFSAEVYKNALAAQGLTDSLVREDLRQGLLAQLMLEPPALVIGYPAAIANRYALLFKERRIGSIGFLPAAAFAPEGAPTQAALERFYQAQRARFIRPERRVIRSRPLPRPPGSGLRQLPRWTAPRSPGRARRRWLPPISAPRKARSPPPHAARWDGISPAWTP